MKEEYRIQMDEQLTEEMSAVGEYGKGLSECYKAKEVAQGMEQGLDEGLKQGFEQGFKEGFEQGLKQGEERIAALLSSLMEAGRIEDVRRVIADVAYRKELYKAFNID